MAVKRKVRGLGTALLLAVSMAALSTGIAHAQQASDASNTLDSLNQQILDNPADVQLNLRYAHAAEAAGKPRLALAAYERILINDSENQEAREGYERVRRQIEPGYTVTRLEVGATFDSNALNLSKDFFFSETPNSTTYYGRLMVANESEILGHRWRSILNLDHEDNQDIDALDYDYVGVQTGPIIYMGPHTAALPAIGGAVSYLDGDSYYSEVNVSFGMEGRVTGASYWWRVRDGYREYNDDHPFFFGPVADHGNYAELVGGIVKPNVFSERGALTISPFLRISNIEGGVFDFFVFDEFSPGKYVEYGADVNYNYQLTDHLQASVGALVRERKFDNNVRNDTYFSPQASLTLQDVLPFNCDLKLQYRRRENDSDEPFRDYDADQLSLSLQTHF